MKSFRGIPSGHAERVSRRMRENSRLNAGSAIKLGYWRRSLWGDGNRDQRMSGMGVLHPRPDKMSCRGDEGFRYRHRDDTARSLGTGRNHALMMRQVRGRCCHRHRARLRRHGIGDERPEGRDEKRQSHQTGDEAAVPAESHRGRLAHICHMPSRTNSGMHCALQPASPDFGHLRQHVMSRGGQPTPPHCAAGSSGKS